MTCACGRDATHVRWGAKSRGDRYDGARIVCCAFHAVHPDKPHPWDIAKVDDWPKAVDA